MTDRQRQKIEAHGRNLLAIFPNATEQDPVRLCKRLRRLEAQGAAIGLRMCNGPEYPTEDAADEETEAVLEKVRRLLGVTVRMPIFVNRDPRGYALKIDDKYVRDEKLAIHQDWGGYGIIAPEITDND